MNGALDVAESSMTRVVARALEVVNDDERSTVAVDEEEDREEENESDDEDGHVWNEIISSARRTSAINPPRESQNSPEKPKLTLKLIKELEPSCRLALSCIPLSKIPQDLLALFNQCKDDNFILKSLKIDRYRDISDFGFLMWQAERDARMKQEESSELFKVFCFCLTDFWSGCIQENFRKDRERTFWVENIVPKVKYLGSMENVAFSWCEDQVKSYQDDQVEKNFWLNSTSNCFFDGVGRNANGQELEC